MKEYNLAKGLKYVLEEKHITQSELAKRTGITEATISRYCNGQRDAMGWRLAAIANALNVRIDDICFVEVHYATR